MPHRRKRFLTSYHARRKKAGKVKKKGSLKLESSQDKYKCVVSSGGRYYQMCDSDYELSDDIERELTQTQRYIF